MTTKTLYPHTVTQLTGTKYRKFKNLANIKNSSDSYAISEYPIHNIKDNHFEPSAITCSDFKFNVPTGARVRKIVVEYRHSKVGHYSPSGDPDGFHPDYNTKNAPNLPAPDIIIESGGNYITSGKGQAPSLTPKSQTKTFNGNWAPSVLNSNTFKVKILNGANTSKYKGYLRIKYVRVRIEYVTSSFSIKSKKSYGGVNGKDYCVAVTVSNLNKTDSSPECAIDVPAGFTLKKSNADIKQVDTDTWKWKPKFTTKVGSKTLWLVFSTDVTFLPGATSATCRFTFGLGSYGVSSIHDAIITKPTSHDEDPTGDAPKKDDFTPDIVPIDLRTVKVNEEFEMTFTITNDMIDGIILRIFNIGQTEGRWSGETVDDEYENILNNTTISFVSPATSEDDVGYLSLNGLIYRKYEDDNTWIRSSFGDALTDFVNDNERTFTLKGVSEGYDEIMLGARYTSTFSGYTKCTFGIYQINIVPDESDLTDPSFAKLPIIDEEANRLGNGYSYTVQSHIKPYNVQTLVNAPETQSLTQSSIGVKTKLLTDALELPLHFELEFDMRTNKNDVDARFHIAQSWNFTPDTNNDNYVFTAFSGSGYIDCGVKKYSTTYTRGDTYSKNTWYHFKIVREYDEFSIYVNGAFHSKHAIGWFNDGQPYYLALATFGSGVTFDIKNILLTYSAESYVRDWYKNFRVGVFNNRIEANCTDYTVFDTSDEDTQDRELNIPSRFDLTGDTLVLSVDKAIDITIDETTYELTDSDSTTLSSLEDWIIPVTLDKNTEDTVILTATLKDSNSNVLNTDYYKIRFGQEETLDPYQTTTDTTDYTNLTDTEIINNAEYWANCPTIISEYNNVECYFQYNKDYPLIILVTGDYPEATIQEYIKFTEPCIVESASYTEREANGNYPYPIDDIILENTSSEVSMESYAVSTPVRLYDLPLDEGYGTSTNLAVRGIQLDGTIEQSSNIILNATLHLPNGEKRARSIKIDEFGGEADSSNSFTLGGNGDLWGFSTLDMVNLERMQIELQYSNILEETQADINFGDITLTIYVEEVESQNIDIKVEGENIAYYGAFIRSLTIPAGLNTDVDFLTIDGTDTNDPYRQNIREKQIELELDIDGCDLPATTLSLQQLTKLLVNEKDQYNRPIPKQIEFSHLPNLYFEYIIEDTIDTTIEINSYVLKAKLTVPSGTAYTKESTVTSNTGYVQGLASISPIIIIKPTDTDIEVVENNTGQKFKITLPEEYNEYIIEIDCEDRICWLKSGEDDDEPINITKHVDFNSDWFSLHGEYQFSTTNCILQTVDYNERW